MTARSLIACDLDRTLIYSRRFLDAAGPGRRCVEVYEGEEISFMTENAVALLTDLVAKNVVIPATTRTVAQYRRITLAGAPYRFAVTSNGGTILVDGMPDQEPVESFYDVMLVAVHRGLKDLHQLLAQLSQRVEVPPGNARGRSGAAGFL